MFVAIDGLDGSGKSTVAQALAADLESDGMRIHVREHPGDGRWGRLARRSLLGHGRAAKTSSAVFLFLDILSTGWRVRRGDHVIAVRYTLSAYYLDGRTSSIVHGILRAVLPDPDTTIVLDVDPSNALVRIGTRGEEQEMFENLDSMQSVRSRMLTADEAITVVDANGTPDEVYARVRDVLGL